MFDSFLSMGVWVPVCIRNISVLGSNTRSGIFTYRIGLGFFLILARV